MIFIVGNCGGCGKSALLDSLFSDICLEKKDTLLPKDGASDVASEAAPRVLELVVTQMSGSELLRMEFEEDAEDLGSSTSRWTWADAKQLVRKRMQERSGPGCFAVGLQLVEGDKVLDDDDETFAWNRFREGGFHNGKRLCNVTLLTSQVMQASDVCQGIPMLLGFLEDMNSSRTLFFKELLAALRSIELGSAEALDEFANIMVARACAFGPLSQDFVAIIIRLREVWECEHAELIARSGEAAPASGRGAGHQEAAAGHAFRRAAVNALQNHFEGQLGGLASGAGTRLDMLATVRCFGELFRSRFVSRIILAKVASDLVDRLSPAGQTCIWACLQSLTDLARETLQQTEDGTLLLAELQHVLADISNAPEVRQESSMEPGADAWAAVEAELRKARSR